MLKATSGRAKTWHMSGITRSRKLTRCGTLDRKTVHKMFDGQPGVLEFGTEEGRFQRGRRSRCIPESVMLRVHCDLRK